MIEIERVRMRERDKESEGKREREAAMTGMSSDDRQVVGTSPRPITQRSFALAAVIFIHVHTCAR